MNLQVNDTGTLLFGDGNTSKVKVVKIDTYRTMPSDIWFSYQEDETHQPLTHPDFEDMFPLPEGLVDMVFTKDKDPEEDKEESDLDAYEEQFEEYLEREIKPENQPEARKLFKRLEELLGREEVAKEYFK